ncbi:MAG: diadenylate cyclase CdaA [Kiritimatiellae bacterium]|nr:diadenylate cyclase CdaA [Kiritimatiellia bacterium]
MTSFLARNNLPDWNGMLEIALLAVAFYYILSFFKGTRGAQILSGLAIVYAALLLLTYALNLVVLQWLLQRFTVYLLVALLIIFQPEIRRALAGLRPGRFFSNGQSDRSFVERLMEAVHRLSENKIGALIVLERSVSTAPYQEVGTLLDSRMSPELLMSIFFPNSALHDGGVIIRGDRIVAAGCVFPLSQRPKMSSALGTRHRAALGLSEETDAIIIVVSEETGSVSIAYKGRLRRGLELNLIERFLNTTLLRGVARQDAVSSSRLRQWIESLGLRTRAIEPPVKKDAHRA